MTDYTQTFEALHRHGIIDEEEFPELLDESFRKELRHRANSVALFFSYDENTGTAALFHEDQQIEGATKRHAAALIAWMHLVWRKDYAAGAEHIEDRQFLTATARRKNRESKEYHLVAPFLTQRFHNTFPTLKAAEDALRDLKREGLLEQAGRDPVRYYATPLLRHVVDEDTAREVVWAHIRGEFQPLTDTEATPRDRVLLHIETLASGYANSPRIAEDLGMTIKQVEGICDRLKQDGLIRHEMGTSQGGAWHPIYADGGEEE